MKRLLVATFLLFATPALSTAAFEGMVSVVQPLGLSDSGPVLSIVNYIGYSVDQGNPWPGEEVLFTTRPNLIWCDGKGQDRNEASLNGIEFRNGGSNTSTDTLQITVYLGSFPKNGQNVDQSDHEILTTTLWCGLLNARQQWPKIRYVHYRVTGGPQFAAYDGVYALESVPTIKEPPGSMGWGPQALRDSCSPKKP